MPTKQDIIAEYQKLVDSCDKELKKPRLREDVRRVVTANRNKAENWIAFLKRPDTPELGW
jgi:hypothetical protein